MRLRTLLVLSATAAAIAIPTAANADDKTGNIHWSSDKTGNIHWSSDKTGNIHWSTDKAGNIHW